MRCIQSDHVKVQGFIHDKLLARTVLHAAGLINNTNGCDHGGVHHLYHTCTLLQMELKLSTPVLFLLTVPPSFESFR